MPKRKPPARRRYDTDWTDAQWEPIAPMIPDARAGGRPRKTTSRELVNAILYFLRAGAA
ncbi:MAG: transposase [Geminicoccaceae bacterium]|nr:transposase [Geminicoccaceae bacterium]